MVDKAKHLGGSLWAIVLNWWWAREYLKPGISVDPLLREGTSGTILYNMGNTLKVQDHVPILNYNLFRQIIY